MKKLLLLTLIAGSTAAMAAAEEARIILPASSAASKATQTREYTVSTAAKAPAKASSSDFDPYYPAPDGVLYLGLDAEADKAGATYALVPDEAELTFKSAFSDGDYIWDYYTDEDVNKELENEDLKVKYTTTKVVSAPSLYCIGYGGRGTYSMALDGLAVGYGAIPTGSGFEYYGSNLNAAELLGQFHDAFTLSANYPDANKAITEYYSGTGVKDIQLKGFGEMFSYCSPYKLDALRADVVYADGTTPEVSHLIAEVYPFDTKSGVDFTKKIATFTATGITKHDDYFYCFDFAPAEAPLIESPVMVIIRPTAECTSIISPGEYGLETLHEGDPGSSFIYASYNFGSTPVEDGCLGYYGVELEGYRGVQYLNHWNVSVKRTYVKGGDSGAEAIEAAESAIVYNAAASTATCEGAVAMTAVSMQGATVASHSGDTLDLSGLAPGIYVITAESAEPAAAIKIAVK